MAKIGKYKDARFEDSLQLIRPALEWAEKQDVERLRRFLVENANIPLYCFSSGGSSASNDYLALLYETNKGMAKSLTPLAMASLSDEALKSAKIIGSVIVPLLIKSPSPRRCFRNKGCP